jgi:predicted ATPase
VSKPPLIKSLTINNLLSFGHNDEHFELEPLNVLIGPNGSGKSNFIELIRLLKSTPKGIAEPIRYGGGIQEWLFKGKKKSGQSSIEAIFNYPKNKSLLRYRLALDKRGERVEIVDELLEPAIKSTARNDDYSFFYRLNEGEPTLSELIGKQGRIGLRHIHRKELHPEKSILQVIKDIDHYPELTWSGMQFESLQIFVDWNTARNSPIRLPQDTASPEDFLLEDASNLNLILNNLPKKSMRLIQEKLSRLFDGAGEISIKLSGGTVQLFLEEGYWKTPTPAVRLSDGTLRYLALLAILCHPSPPPLICLEEPELGIHPDVILDIAELLKEASTRTQLIVTTHSSTLVSAFNDMPSAIVVVEKDERGTKLKRLEPDRMALWLERYSLGELWEKGEIGGNRW